jgi:hypothetical protein
LKDTCTKPGYNSFDAECNDCVNHEDECIHHGSIIVVETELQESTPEEAHERYQRICTNLTNSLSAQLEAAQDLYLAYKNKDWKALGYKKWEEYLAGSYGHLMASRKTSYLRLIHEQLGSIVREKPEGHSITKLRYIAAAFKDEPEDVRRKWVEESRELTIEQLQNNIKEVKGTAQPTDTCEHPSDKQEAYLKCTVCNKLRKA